MPDVNRDPEFREKIIAMMDQWERYGQVLPDWSVEYDTGDGCYRTTFTACAIVEGDHPGYRYSFTEAELCQYVLGLVDLAPKIAGSAACALADASRETAS